MNGELGFYLVLHVIHAAENQKVFSSRMKVVYTSSFLAFTPVIKNFHVNGPGIVVLSFRVSATQFYNYEFFRLLNLLKT